MGDDLSCSMENTPALWHTFTSIVAVLENKRSLCSDRSGKVSATVFKLITTLTTLEDVSYSLKTYFRSGLRIHVTFHTFKVQPKAIIN